MQQTGFKRKAPLNRRISLNIISVMLSRDSFMHADYQRKQIWQLLISTIRHLCVSTAWSIFTTVVTVTKPNSMLWCIHEWWKHLHFHPLDVCCVCSFVAISWINGSLPVKLWLPARVCIWVQLNFQSVHPDYNDDYNQTIYEMKHDFII